jgi:hypothetical protein
VGALQELIFVMNNIKDYLQKQRAGLEAERARCLGALAAIGGAITLADRLLAKLEEPEAAPAPAAPADQPDPPRPRKS